MYGYWAQRTVLRHDMPSLLRNQTTVPYSFDTLKLQMPPGDLKDGGVHDGVKKGENRSSFLFTFWWFFDTRIGIEEWYESQECSVRRPLGQPVVVDVGEETTKRFN